MFKISPAHRLWHYRIGRRRFGSRSLQRKHMYSALLPMTVLLAGLVVLHPTRVLSPHNLHSYATVSNVVGSDQKALSPPTSQLPAQLLIIPKLKDTIPYTAVGLTDDRQMAVPHDTGYAGLYKYGPRPGQLGSAVIDGHNQILGNGNGVFWNLKQLTAGDDLYIQDGSSSRIHFVVTHTEKYAASSAPLMQIFGNADKAHLNLITCDGKWDRTLQAYTQRLVVYTDLVN